MNAKPERLPTKFGPETRFEVRPAPPAPFRALQENLFEQLKNRLLHEELEGSWVATLSGHVRRAANEAAALAWVTPYPLLVFPALFDEKLEAARDFVQRQEQVHQRTRELLVL